MDKLDFLDFLQIISIIIAFILGFLPNFISVKDQGKITNTGLSLIIFFCFSVLFAVGTTIYKSVDDKEKYETTIKSSDSTLNQVKKTLKTSNNILLKSDSSLITLSNLQDKSQSLQKKSDSIQTISNSLNNKLKQEILIQQKTNRSANDLVSNMKYQNDKQKSNYRFSLALTCTRLQVTYLNIYAGYEIVAMDSNLTKNNRIISDKVIKKIHEIKKREINVADSIFKLKGESEEYKNYYNTHLNDTVVKIIDNEIKNYLIVYDATEKKNILLMAKDSNNLLVSIKLFCEQTHGLLSTEMTNPVLLEEGSLFIIWINYSNYIFNFKNKLNLYGTTYLSSENIKELMNKTEEFNKTVLTFKISSYGFTFTTH